MKLKKRTRKQLLRLVAMVLFVAMIINSTASSYADYDTGGENTETFEEDTVTEDNLIPAMEPEDTTGNSEETTESETVTPDESTEMPEQGQPAESTETPETTTPDAGSTEEPAQTPEAVEPTETPAGPDADTNVSPSAELGETMPSVEPSIIPDSEPSESPTLSPSSSPTATATPTPTLEPTASPSPSAEVELVDSNISSTASDNALIEISGLLPEDATVSVTFVDPTKVDLDGQEVLAAYDITILDKDGREYKITNQVTVTISDISGLKNVFAKSVNVYHMENEYAKAERISDSDVSVSGDSVTFTAGGFSIYVVTVDNTMNLADEDGGIVIGEPKGLEDMIESVELQGGVPEGGFKRDASLTFKFSYAIPADNLNEYKAAPYWTYSISDLLNEENAIFKEILAGGTGKIYEGSREVGYYEIDTDNDEVRFYVTDKSWFDGKTDGVEGTFYLACELDSAAIGTETSKVVEVGGQSFTLNFEEPSVQSEKVVEWWKTDGGTVYKKEGEKIRYDITVKPNSDLNELTLEDNLGKYQTLVDNKVTVKMTASDGSYYETEAVVDVDENGEFTLDLADIFDIKANATYTITYETTVTGDGWGKEQVNIAQWTWKGKDGPEQKTEENRTTITVVKSSSSKKYEKSEPVVDENGRKTYTFTYTLTVGEGNSSGYTIRDIISKNQIFQGNKIEIRDKDGGLLTSITPNNPVGDDGVLFEYTFPEGSINGPYTITYTTKSDNENYIGNQNVTNTLETEKDGITEKPNTGDWVDYGGEKEKPQIEKVFSEHDEANKRVWWTITVKVPEGTTIHDAKITETDFKYYLYDQYGNQDNQDGYGMGINMSLADITYLSGGKVDESQYDINYQDNTITFEELTQSIVIKVPTTYESLPDGRTVGFYNKVELHEGEIYLDSDEDTHKVDNFLYPFAKSIEEDYNPQTGTVKWKILIDALYMEFDDETLPYYVVDMIPEGMEYVEGSFQAKNDYYAYGGPSGWVPWPYDEEHTPKIEQIGTRQKFTLKLPAGLNGAQYELYYETKVVDNSTLDSVTYTNDAELQDSKGKTLVEAQSSVTVEHKEEDILDKRVASYVNGTDEVEYVIEVNKEGLDLSDDDTLTLEDRIPDGTELVIRKNTIQAFGADGEPISVSYRYVNRVLTIIIPDETHVTIKYSILIKEEGTQNIVNTVTLRGKKIFSDSDNSYYQEVHHGGTLTGTEGTIKIEKFDDQMNPLDGAEFAVYEVSYDAQTGIISDFIGTIVGEPGTTANGGILELGGLSAGKLYYWVETKAPAGYKQDTEEHYFAIYNSDGSGNAENSVTRQQLKDIIALIKSANPKMKDTYIEMADKATWVTAGNEYNGGEFGSLVVKKSFTGVNLTDGQKNNITFTVTGPDGEIESFTYEQMPEEGKKYDNLPAGKYTVTEINDDVNGYVHEVTYEVNGSEVSAPEGHVSDGNETTIEIINDYQLPKGNLKVTKKFAGLSEEILNNLTDDQKKAITFTVTDSQDQEVAKFSYYQMKNESITIPDLVAGEKYTIKEDGNAEILGYVFVTATYNEGNTTGNNPNGLEVEVKAGGTAEVTVTNHYKELGKLTVTKTIDGIDKGDVEGLFFEIEGPIRSDKSQIYKVTYAEMTGSDKTRSKTFDNLPAGTYKVTEKNANVEGYSVTTTYYVGENTYENVDSVDNVSVDNGKTTVVNVTNKYEQLFGRLTLTKIINGLVLGDLTEEEIEKLGIQFTIVGIDSNGQEIYNEKILYAGEGWIETADGRKRSITIDDLPYGIYTVTETCDALEGYVISASYVIDGGAVSKAVTGGSVNVEVTIGEDAANREIIFTNAYSTLGELTLTKTFTFDGLLTDEEINNLKDIAFTVTGPMEADEIYRRSYTIGLDEMTDKESGVYKYEGEKLKNLPYGTYTITESAQSLGEKYNRTVEIVVDEVLTNNNSREVELVRDNHSKTVDINNTYTPKLIEIPVEKFWDDNSNQDNKRPESITVYVYVDGDEEHHIKEITLPQDTQSPDEDKDMWQGIFTGLRKYDAEGNPIPYRVGEVLSEGSGYSLTSVTGNPKSDGNYDVVLTNKHTPETTGVSVTKIWDDGDYTDITHPEITLVLLKAVNGGAWESTGQTVALPKQDGNEEEKWQHTFTGLPVYEEGNKISYTVLEVQLDDKYEYESSKPNVVPDGDGNYSITVTNTYKPEFVEIPVEKVWLDGNDVNARPAITVILKKNGEEVQSITIDSSNGWKQSFTDLPKYDENGEINYTADYYTVEETVPDGYITEEEKLTITKTGEKYDTVTITNTQLTDIDVEKVWEGDNNDEDGMRPEYIIVYLKIGNDIQDEIMLNNSNSWKGSFTGLPKYDSNGETIEYLVEEVLPEDYRDEGLYDDLYTLQDISDIVSGKITITNAYTRKTTSIPVTKVWDDISNQDGERPDSITIRLVAYVNSQESPELSKEVTLRANDEDVKLSNNDNIWEYVFENLPVYYNGYEVEYRKVVEVSYDYDRQLDEGDKPDYQSTEGDKENGYTITNSYTPGLKSVTVNKVWIDNGDQDGVRPDEIEVTLYVKNGDVLKKADVKQDEDNPVILSKENNWSYQWSDLPKNKDYWVKETSTMDEHYTHSGTEWNENETVITITNTHETEKTDVSVTKEWIDGGAQDINRPSIEVYLYKKVGESLVPVEVVKEGETNPATLSGDDWSYTWRDLPKKENGEDIEYTVEEVSILGYESSEPNIVVDKDGNYSITITNTQVTNIEVTKAWEDGIIDDSQHASVTVKLQANGTDVATKDNLVLSKSNGWKDTWEALPVYDSDGLIEYTVVEINVPDGYEVSYGDMEVNQEGNYEFTITNTQTTNVDVTKKWEDDGNGTHTDVIIHLLASAEEDEQGEVAGTVTLPKEDAKDGEEWQHTFENLPVYDEDGEEIHYTVEEVEVPGYMSEVTGDSTNGFIITNTKVTDIEVTKVWKDDITDDSQHASVTVKLQANNFDVDDSERVLSADEDWKAKWENLPVYSNGEKITYTVVEENVPNGYVVSYSDMEFNAETGHYEFTVTNIQTTDIDVIKEWDDQEYIIVTHPEVTIHLLASVEGGDSTEVDKVTLPKQDVVDDEEKWQHTFEDLPVYDKDGKRINYTVSEDRVDDFVSDISPKFENADEYVVTNTYIPESIEIPVQKKWIDGNAENRPQQVTIYLVIIGQDGEEIEVVESITLPDQDDNWYRSFTVPKYDQDGDEIQYAVREEVVGGYSSSVESGNVNGKNGYIITNTKVTDVEVTKDWQDSNDADDLRPDSVTVQLTVGETPVGDSLVLDESNHWSDKWQGLPLYDNDGNEIQYIVKEVDVPEGYSESYSKKFNDQTGNYEFVITNTHTPETGRSVEKVWNDGLDEHPGVVVEVQLYAETESGNSVQIELGAGAENPVELSDEKGWSYIWEDLPVYDSDGAKIEYSVQEKKVPEGYKSTVASETGSNHFVITNTKVTDVEVNKEWNDVNNEDGLRKSVTVKLQASVAGIEDREQRLNESNGWSYTWHDLPVYDADGTEIKYSVIEENVPDGYSVDVQNEEGSYIFTVVNTHMPTVDVEGSKTWNHGTNNQPDNQPKSITVILYEEDASGDLKEVDKKTVGEGNNWSWKFTDLPKYEENGKLITYVIGEVPVKDYHTDVIGYNLANTYDGAESTPTPSATPTATAEVTATSTPTATPGEVTSETATPSPGATSIPVPTRTPTPASSGTPILGETPVPSETPTPAVIPTPASSSAPTPGVITVPSGAPASEETPAPEDAHESTPEEYFEAPAPTAAPTEPPMQEAQVLQPRRYQVSGTEGMVLGARRGMDYAVLGMRRRPSTGDSTRLLWWLLSLFTALGGCITSGVMLMFGRKED